ncbi:MAG: response regulator [Desulfobacterales bacterium]
MEKNKSPLQRQALKGRVHDHAAREEPDAPWEKTGRASMRRSARKDRQDLVEGIPLRVLVVDFHAAILEVVAMMFKALGCRVSIAQGSQEAVKCLSSMPFDLVVSEFDMSTLNGCQLAALVKDNSPKAKVLIMTGLCQSEVAAEMSSPHVDGWIFKPFGLEELLDVLELMNVPETCPRYPGIFRVRYRMTQAI